LDFIVIAFGLIGRTGEVCSFLISSKAFFVFKKGEEELKKEIEKEKKGL